MLLMINGSQIGAFIAGKLNISSSIISGPIHSSLLLFLSLVHAVDDENDTDNH